MELITEIFGASNVAFVLHGMERELTRYTVFAVSMYVIIVLILTPLFRQRKIRRSTPGYSQMGAEFLRSLRTMVVFVAMDMLIFRALGLRGIWWDADLGWPYWPWLIGSVIVGVVWHDTWFYWMHRLMHTPRLYKALHFTHHKSVNPTPFTAYSFAVGEAALEYLFIPPLVLLLPMAPGAVFWVIMIMFVKNVTGHGGFELFPKGSYSHPILRHFTTVTHHDMHHSNGGGNYGLHFTWWDRWMGTEHKHYAARFEAVASRKRGEVAGGAVPGPAETAPVSLSS